MAVSMICYLYYTTHFFSCQLTKAFRFDHFGKLNIHIHYNLLKFKKKTDYNAHKLSSFTVLLSSQNV